MTHHNVESGRNISENFSIPASSARQILVMSFLVLVGTASCTLTEQGMNLSVSAMRMSTARMLGAIRTITRRNRGLHLSDAGNDDGPSRS
ncbi:hypothetical protein DACRYDRAFT_25559 [Dacryopinax primogenitus]|uniref:Uncharacterized protein n=1 Tax=Dacryopinax primogenitus (strain DJM 731) TaxID=1858805 RepID=M5FZ37_DACPD|nr:uncharacterized protein DACRYDRAFT_25559 [Dacryopinax primogenitus]EJT96747.1 hypothetical protein DACRYDRAFT_25559 [Dacryopinax primogenitus]